MTRPCQSSPWHPPAPLGALTVLCAALSAATAGGISPARAASPSAAVAPTPGDPWERVNRTNYAIQGTLDRRVIRPLAKLYRWLTPGPIGRGVHNALVNLSEPRAFLNDLLQLRFKRAGVPAARFITNSTIGVLGLFDIAARAGIAHHDNEFGVTLGRAGVSAGPYIYLPLIGPGTARDLVGSGVDFVTDPMYWVSRSHGAPAPGTRLAVTGLDTEVATEAQLDALLSGAVDPYATLRSVYLQNKQGEIEGGGVPAELPSFDEPAPAGPAPAPAGAAPAPAGPAPPVEPEGHN